jgi:hypothetical protein
VPSLGTTKRISRIRRRALPEVREAYERGQISARMADTMLYLPAAHQRAELNRRLNEARQREACHRLVADAIREYLDSLNGRKVDLIELSKIIQKSLV